jgi:hypothetical protein
MNPLSRLEGRDSVKSDGSFDGSTIRPFRTKQCSASDCLATTCLSGENPRLCLWKPLDLPPLRVSIPDDSTFTYTANHPSLVDEETITDVCETPNVDYIIRDTLSENTGEEYHGQDSNMILDASPDEEDGGVNYETQHRISLVVLSDLPEFPDMNEYPCATEKRDDVKPQGLSLHVCGTEIPRWKPGSTLYYFVVARGKESLFQGMRDAVRAWSAKNIGIYFEETNNSARATFKVIYDGQLPLNDYAVAFFPGDRNRVLRVGPRSFWPQYRQYISNVLCHELGHIIGLRHELWQFPPYPESIPACYFPTIPFNYESVLAVINYASVMNHRLAYDLSLLVVSDRDGDETRRFYLQQDGPYGMYHIKNHSTSTCTISACRC